VIAGARCACCMNIVISVDRFCPRCGADLDPSIVRAHTLYARAIEIASDDRSVRRLVACAMRLAEEGDDERSQEALFTAVRHRFRVADTILAELRETMTDEVVEF
jgi:hypothetical protein